MTTVTIIGRGHSGTRLISHTLSASGVYMGARLNRSGDLVPPDEMYEACRIVSRQVRYLGDMRWDFTRLHEGAIDPAFTRRIGSYLESVLTSLAQPKGWKIPETTLVYPWIVRLFPDVHYIHWVRDPRDCILGSHVTDDLTTFGVPCERTEDVYLRRAMSWKYQADIVKATPQPKRFRTVPFEWFVLNQGRALASLQEFLGFPLAKIPVRPSAAGRWKRAAFCRDFPFFKDNLSEHGYQRGGGMDRMVEEAVAHSVGAKSDKLSPAATWEDRLERATQELVKLIPERETFILVDNKQWGAGTHLAGRRCFPFLECNGEHWGNPPDDSTAIQELKRLREVGASFLAFAWPSFWWLDYYCGFHQHLRWNFPCLLEDDLLVAFDLRKNPLTISPGAC